MRLSTILLWVLVLSVGLGLLIVMFDQTIGYRYADLRPVWLGLFFIAAGAIAAAPCAFVRERGKARVLMISGLIAILAAAVVWAWTIALTLSGEGDPEFQARIAAVPSAWAAAVMIIGLLLLPRFSRPLSRTVRIVAVVSVLALAAQVIAWIWLRPIFVSGSRYELNRFDDVMFQIFMIAAIIAGAACLLTYILARTRDVTGEQIPDHERKTFSITCPRCSSRVNLRTEGDTCNACGLRINVSAL